MNTLGTEKVKYSLSPPTPQKPKKQKNWALLFLSLSLLIGCMKKFILKFVCQHFSGGLMESMGSMGVDW
jgi:hypothetical protein